MKQFKSINLSRTVTGFLYVFILMAGLTVLSVQTGCKKGLVLNDTIGEDAASIYPLVPPPDYWPTGGWQSTTPEQQGMDSGSMADMIDYIADGDYPIRSITVVRKGYLVMEAYFHPFEKGLWHVIHSCSKSVLSSLVGIAVRQGQIRDEGINVLDTFSNISPANTDERKEAMQLKHLLTMSTGMNARDSYLYGWEGLTGMRNSSNWTRYVLDLPMLNVPGTVFDYSNCSSYLIAALLHRVTGQNGLDYAHAFLFNHLGVAEGEVMWPLSPEGVVYGYGEIRMQPLDMAKFGLLYLHRGRWDGTEVVPEPWVNKSTKTQMTANTLSNGYGYQWWVDENGYFMAMGYGGQYIIVNPALDLVVTFSSALRDADFFLPEILYRDHVLPAVVSDEAIADNLQQQQRLAAALQRVGNPPAQPVPALSATALAVSGKSYQFDTNAYDYHSMGITFTPGASEANLTLSYRDRNLNLPLGLDDRYRTTFQEGYYRSYKGRWESENTFLVHYRITDHTEWGYYRLVFSGNRVTVTFQNERYDDFTVLTGSY